MLHVLLLFVPGPGLDVTSADDLLERFPLQTDSVFHKLLFLPLANLNCSQYDMKTGSGIRSAFNQLNQLLKEAFTSIVDASSDEAATLLSIRDDLTTFHEKVDTFCYAMKRSIQTNGADGDRQEKSKENYKEGDNNDLHNSLVAIMFQLIKLSSNPSVLRMQDFSIR